MFFRIFIFILTPTIIQAASLQVNGNMEFKPKLKYEYRIRNYIDTINNSPSERASDVHSIDGLKPNPQPQIIDIIIKNDNNNPNLLKIGEARVYEKYEADFLKKIDKSDDKIRKLDENSKKTDSNGTKNIKNDKKSKNIDNSDEKTSKNNTIASKKPHKHLKLHKSNSESNKVVDEKVKLVARQLGEIDASNTHTGIQTYNKHTETHTDSKASKDNDLDVTGDDFQNNLDYDAPMQVSDENNIPPYTVIGINKKKRQKKTKIAHLRENSETKPNGDFDHTNGITVEEFPKRVTELIDSVDYKDIYVSPRLVKDDQKIKEFTKHVYEQSIKTFENIKDKLSDYGLKHETEKLMRSYEEKFGDFVRETQNQKIKTRLGNQKVILNTLDTSNRILDRLTNYLIGKMDNREALRMSGAENVIKNEIKKKKDLENIHVCTKFQICRTRDSFTNFVIDILTIVLSSNDKKIIEFRDASTEVLINTYFGSIMAEDTEHRFRKKLRDFETINVIEFKAVLAIAKNMLTFRNGPIQIVGHEDSRLNRTVSFFEITDLWDKNIPANESNLLEWNDLRNSFKEWSEGKRNDIVEIMQSFVDLFIKANKNNNFIDTMGFDRNVNTFLGY